MNEKHEAAAALRAKGLSYDSIGAELGVDGSTIQYWLKPEYREHCRKRDQRRKDVKNAQARERYARKRQSDKAA